jgi:hypothetical protein
MSGQVTITQLPTASALTGSESVPIVQGNGMTVQTTTSAISGAGALNYPFLTVGSTAGLTQARYLGTTTGLSLTDNGAGSTLTINMTGAASSLNAASTGFIVKDSASTVTNRLFAVGAGMTIANADGTAGNPTFGLNTNLQNLASLTGTGLMTISGSTFSQTSIIGTTNQISIANGNAVGGSPTISLATDPVLPGTGGVQIPSGSNAQRLTVNGVMRYNTDSSRFEFYQSSAWATIGTGDGTVTNVQGTVNQISVANGTTVPVVSISSNPTLPGSAFVQLPSGTTSQRGTPNYGAFRYNSETSNLEVYKQLRMECCIGRHRCFNIQRRNNRTYADCRVGRRHYAWRNPSSSKWRNRRIRHIDWLWCMQMAHQPWQQARPFQMLDWQIAL